MGEKTAIAWTDHTFNPWWGCTKVSPACHHCYAETFAKRTGHDIWGPAAQRRFFGPNHWMAPLKWNEAAGRRGVPAFVFCASMADVFETVDERAPDGIATLLDAGRARLWVTIERTPWLTWLLLSKRPESGPALVPATWMAGAWPRNAWVGATVESDAYRWRIDALRALPAPRRFLSCEPLAEPLDLRGHLDGIAWAIFGGESGPKARPFDVQWARAGIAACREAGALPFVKQLGARPFSSLPGGSFLGFLGGDGVGVLASEIRDRAGADPSEWPADLRVQERPAATVLMAWEAA